jgi:hypothetical protein
MNLIATPFDEYCFYKVDSKVFVAWTGAFGNCQNITIRFCNYLLTESSTYINNYFFELYNKTGRPYVIIDINYIYFNKLTEFMKENSLSKLKIVSHQPYKNGNGSNMNLIVLDIKNLRKITNE